VRCCPAAVTDRQGRARLRADEPAEARTGRDVRLDGRQDERDDPVETHVAAGPRFGWLVCAQAGPPLAIRDGLPFLRLPRRGRPAGARTGDRHGSPGAGPPARRRASRSADRPRRRDGLPFLRLPGGHGDLVLVVLLSIPMVAVTLVARRRASRSADRPRRASRRAARRAGRPCGRSCRQGNDGGVKYVIALPATSFTSVGLFEAFRAMLSGGLAPLRRGEPIRSPPAIVRLHCPPVDRRAERHADGKPR
jgi:hypothetical protein